MMNYFSIMRYHILLLIVLLLVAACAPDDLDVTPTAAPTDIPVATPTPTPLPAGQIDALQNGIDTFLAVVPARLGAGGIEWRRDFTVGEEGVEIPPNVQNGLAVRVYYLDQSGSRANLTFGIFDTNEAATAHYDRMHDVRRGVLDTGRPNEDFPMPNVFGAGTYGSVAIMQIEDVFVEVNIEVFTSSEGNPLVALARSTMSLVNQVLAELDAGTAES